MSEADLLYEVREHVAWITLNREARRNALSMEMITLFLKYLDDIAASTQVRVVCVSAVGDKAFCSGADLASGDPLQGAKKYCELLKTMIACPKPIVAKIQGHCMAGGMGIMLACDIVYAAEHVKFGTPEVKVGLFPMMVTALLMRNVGRKKAMEMLFTGNPLSAHEAEEMGLITRAYSVGDLDAKVSETLSSISSRAPLAVSMGKKAISAIEGKGLDESLDYLSGQLAILAGTEDAMEGMSAFLAKRPPVWKGR